VSDASGARRSLATLVGLGVLNHSVLGGLRVEIALDALARGATAATVGLLMALFALLPMFFSVAIGRFVDRTGGRGPMIAGSALLACSTALPAVFPGYPALFLSSTIAGFAFILFQIPVQQTIGDMGEPRKRAKRFSQMALGYSISGMAGPLSAGLAIDAFGFRTTYLLLAIVPLVPLVVLASRPLSLPAPVAAAPRERPRALADLWRHRVLRRVLAINTLFAVGWDLHTVFVPVVGARLGLAAAEIGLVLATFGAATFAVRLAMPWIASRAAETDVIAVALFTAAVAYATVPFAANAGVLALISFAIGLGLGSGQPMVMSLLSARAPPGRMGEVVGLRITLAQSMSVAVPLAFGTLGSTLGLAPVFWGVGACLATGGVLVRRRE